MMRPIRRFAFLATLLACACATPTPAHAGTLVVLNKSDATVSLLDPITGETRATLGVGIAPHEAATSPDGAIVVVCNYGSRTPGSSLNVIDIATMKTVRRIDVAPYHRPHGITFFDATRVLVTAETEKKLLLVNLESGDIEAAIDTSQRGSHMVAVTPDGARAFVANIRDGSVSVIDLGAKKLIEVIPTGAGAEGIAAHPSRDEVWVTNRGANSVSVIETRSLEIVATLDAGQFPIRVAFTPDGAHALVSCAGSGDVWVYDSATREVVTKVAMDEEPVAEGEKKARLFSDRFGESPVPVGVQMTPDGARAFVANTNADVISVIDLNTWRVVDRLRAGREPDGMTYSRLP